MVYTYFTRDISERPQAEAIGCKELQIFQKSQVQNFAHRMKQPNAMVQAED